ncbi:uncharacterized protein LOC110984959 isoform X2 [Acanthaster planci]|uniref:Uncharacterized protein LOC110984959 isoform X2 n=1 Tax=Acanthaster planci TaxID=133434 RepID=A0A8B7Z937_ACAPL|nr:uncharacterized protein LOC110984959 isoform X2 [Acanthaster planci]
MEPLRPGCCIFTLSVGLLLEIFVGLSSCTVQRDYCSQPANLSIPACQTTEAYNQTGLLVPLNNITYFPNILGHEIMLQAKAGYHDFHPFLQAQCSPHLQQFLCLVFFPRCFPGMAIPLLPCRTYCQRIRDDCMKTALIQSTGVAWPESLNCEILDNYDSDNLCIDPFFGEGEDDGSEERNDGDTEESARVTPAPPAVRPDPSQRCQPLPDDPICQAMPYSTVIFPNIAGQQDPAEALEELHKYSVFMSDAGHCSDLLRTFLCLTYLPPCKVLKDIAVPIPPCQSLCEQVLTKSCLSVMAALKTELPPSLTDCSIYSTQSESYPTCLMPGVHYDPLVPWSLPEIIASQSSENCKEYGCLDVPHAECYSLWYTVTVFPTTLGYTSMQEAMEDLDLLAPLIDSGCSADLLNFACAGAFTTEGLGSSHTVWPLPCQTVCEDIWKSCRTKAKELLEKRPRVLKCHLYPEKDCYPDVKKPQEPVTILNASRVNLTQGIVEFIKDIGYVWYDKILRHEIRQGSSNLQWNDTGLQKIYVELPDKVGYHALLWSSNINGRGTQPSTVWFPPYVTESLPDNCERADIMHCSRLGYDTVVRQDRYWQWDPPDRLLTDWQNYFSEDLLESGDGCLPRLHELLCTIMAPPCSSYLWGLQRPCREFCTSVRSACNASSHGDQLNWLLGILPCDRFSSKADSSRCIKEFDWMTSEASIRRDDFQFFDERVRVYCLVEEETPESPPEFYGPDGELIPPTLPSGHLLSGGRVMQLSPRLTMLYFDKVRLEDTGTYTCKSAGGNLPRTTIIRPLVRCIPSFNHTLCAPFLRTGFVQSPDVLGHTSQYQAEVSSYHFLPLLSTKCSPDLLELVCALYAPECTNDVYWYDRMWDSNLPSQQLCRRVKSACTEAATRIGFEWPVEINCDKLPFDDDDQPEVSIVEQMVPTKRDCINLRRYDITDKGIEYLFYGWVDVQGQGTANDYCRVVSIGQFKMLSCALAGTQGQSQYNYDSPNPETWLDLGHTDTWYMKDEDGDGRDDYCRCVSAPPDTYISCLRAGEKGFEGEFKPHGAIQGDCQHITVNRMLGP